MGHAPDTGNGRKRGGAPQAGGGSRVGSSTADDGTPADEGGPLSASGRQRGGEPRGGGPRGVGGRQGGGSAGGSGVRGVGGPRGDGPKSRGGSTPGGLCAGRVVVVTGAGRGLGRAHALAFAAEGARVVVNDLDVGLDGGTDPAATDGARPGPADRVVAEIRARGGDAVAHGGDIATTDGAASLIGTALDTYGRLDTLVNNAGFLRDRMLVNLDEDDWDAVTRVHLKGHFLPLKHAAAHWRAQAKAGARPSARIVNTSSGAGLLGSVGQGNYSAAKAGIVGLTLVAAAELARYGVHVNAVAPAARTRMTERTFAETMAAPGTDARDAFDAMAPENVSPLVVWLGSAASEGVTGRVFEAEAGRITVMEGWRPGPTADRNARWTPAEAGEETLKLLSAATPPGAVYGAR